MSDDTFHAPTPHVHERATDLGEAADTTPPGGLKRAEDEAESDRGRIGEPGSGDAAISTAVPTSPDL